MAATSGRRIVIVGGGAAGIDVAARLRRAGEHDIVLVEPSGEHFYQAMWTLIGGGRGSMRDAVRAEWTLVPKGVRWLQDAATAVYPEQQLITTKTGAAIEYDRLVLCPGLQLDWTHLPGLAESVGTHGIGTTYRHDLAAVTWNMIRELRSGTAVFAMPRNPIKCPAAPQKIAYLAADWWRRQGVLNNIHVMLVLPTPVMLAQSQFAAALARVAARYGIEVLLGHEVTEILRDSREVVITDHHGDAEKATSVHYDFVHAIPPQSAPDWVKESNLSDGTTTGYVAVDKHTLQHVRYPHVFALGDVANTPNPKSAASIRKQAPVVVTNLLAGLRDQELTARYDGYAACSVTTTRDRVLLAEFDYDMVARRTVPLLDTQRERYDLWLLERYGLPFMYWRLMMRGLV